MNYNPHIHHRKSIRLKGYDYSQAGLYFVTICCDGMKCRFGNIANAQMNLNEFGTIAYNEWAKLPERFPNFILDVFQIMPNHMHGIIALHNVRAGLAPAPNNNGNKIVRASLADAQNDNADAHNNNANAQNGQGQALPLPPSIEDNKRAGASPAQTNASIGDIVGAYKSLVANACIDICNQKNIRLGKLWQRNFYEHIIRDEKSYQRIANYIINNPAQWKEDKFFKE